MYMYMYLALYCYYHHHYCYYVGSSVGLPVVPSGGLSAVPIHLTNWFIRVRPQGWGLKFCTHPLEWEKASYRAASTELRSCDPLSADIANKTHPFRLALYMYTCTCVHVHVHIHVHVHVHVYYMYKYMCTCTCTCTHVFFLKLLKNRAKVPAL